MFSLQKNLLSVVDTVVEGAQQLLRQDEWVEEEVQRQIEAMAQQLFLEKRKSSEWINEVPIVFYFFLTTSF